MVRKTAVRLVIMLFILGLIYGIYFCSQAFPIAAGYGAKTMCSAIFVSGRNEKDVKAEDLDFMPLNTATYKIDYRDSSVTCSLLGFAPTKAIYRQGLGSTLINDITEKALRSQPYRIPQPPGLNTDTIDWPMGDRVPGHYPAGIDSAVVASAVQKVFDHKETKFTNITRALLVLYDGQLVAEKYAEGFNKDTKLTGWSMAKSVTGALTGILVQRGKLTIDGPAPVPEWRERTDPRHSIAIKNLLQQTTGLDFDEIYDKPSHANRMLFTKGDAAAFAASQKLQRPAGSHFRYSSGNSNILSRICRQAIGDTAYHAFPYQNLFYKLGMYHTVMEPDASGTFVGSSFCFATLRDWARFGLFYANNGRINNEQILPADWVRRTTAPSSAAEQGEYGFQWWLNAGEKNNPANRLFPELPTDMFWADGFEGQNIFVIPSKKLVVVRLGLTRNRYWGEHEFLKSVIEAER